MMSDRSVSSVIELCKSLIQAKSYSGEEKQMSDLLSRFFESHGFNQVEVDRYGNTIGSICGKLPGPSILLDGHMDTVPVEDETAWTFPPFEGVEEGGRIYGRGASDMKGAIAAMMTAASLFAEKYGSDFPGSIHVSGTVHEECFEGVAAAEVSRAYKPDFVIIGEATELNLCIGQRGRAEIKAETFGKAAHSANPEKGVNAVTHMMALLAALKEIPERVHDRLGKGLMELVDIKSFPYPGASVLPERCLVTFDRRLLVGETPEDVLAPIFQVVSRLEEKIPVFSAQIGFAEAVEQCFTGEKITGRRFFPAWLFDESEDFIRRSYRALRSIGQEPAITTYSFCTNGSRFAGEDSIRTIGYGPSRENLAHTVDEYIEISQLTCAVKGYFAIIEALTGVKKY